MPLVPMRQILDEAAKGGYGVGAFNVNNMEQIQAIMEAANETNSPVIIQASRGALQYSRLIYLKKLMEAACEEYPHIPVSMHLDHGNSLKTLKTAIDLGFTSVMMDGSLGEDGKTPNTYEQNVEITRAAVEMSHPLGVTVEGELGVLGGIEDGHGAGLTDSQVQDHLTDPNQAEDFVQKTGLDALAVAIGTSHGAYKSGRKDPKTGEVLPPTLAMDRIHAIHEKMPNCHMVMHGSSSVPQELVDIINQYGGKMPGTFGIPIEQIQDGIKHGVRKINVDTDSRLACTGAIRKVFAEKPAEFDMRKYLGPARDAMKQVYIDRMLAFGQAGHAGDYKPMSLDDMKKVYGK
ncbi:MAG TPA: ketose-bisphosphate aldolase [Candidatus Hydrogenedentes bacterium]|nr:ketose-bisphosphate aldolase [Candidatus Hydrogenedentota bacterium]MDY0031213.1 ketose-bisphosphate aldolase [FCB group bacterium]NLT59442.1 fructose-bisphosphate aldolase class II [Candidatus Hydrogenedentota bacterium]HNV21536.1 ketose-bisphosphate aldolase [Candidatus Hydrogenedentota bacterium]HNZ18920.1 ketose-bisphosphate aldolase [Candidatus Hydrogenedentota bacterium]